MQASQSVQKKQGPQVGKIQFRVEDPDLPQVGKIQFRVEDPDLQQALVMAIATEKGAVRKLGAPPKSGIARDV